ncbi:MULTISPECIES: flagellar export chaperone FlgN [Rheinheimera]|jgi:flagellar biosynthesis protein FlgN|uniref:flagellar export chaperone FlgN n=1 Tax=Rheinheimera TaxID=67575 RepID=UPI001E56613B|nr:MULTISPECIES: flagellar export chaperone FlgN [Rheinheimera]HJS15961.1 flagellar export chaperone FlgN [Rheinheimera sp.]
MNQTALKHIIAGLQHDADLLQQLSPMLQKQYVLMSMRQSSELELLNQKAAMLLEQLNRNATERYQAMSVLQLQPTQQGFERLLSSLPEKIREASQQLLNKVQRHTELCQQLNQKNGELLAHQRQLMQNLLGMENKTSYPDMPLG